jgi:hypothetical protein
VVFQLKNQYFYCLGKNCRKAGEFKTSRQRRPTPYKIRVLGFLAHLPQIPRFLTLPNLYAATLLVAALSPSPSPACLVDNHIFAAGA